MVKFNKIIELLTRIICDIRPVSTSDAAYLFTQTQDNQDSVLRPASELLNNSLVRKILILKTRSKSGYPGFSPWKKSLNELGVSDDYIEGVHIDAVPALNTLVDAKAMVRFAKLTNYKSIFIVAAPFHQLRAFMTAVTVVLREYPDLKLYSKVGYSLPWLENVMHSQGNTKDTRLNLIKREFERIEKYQQKGDLASIDEVLNYLNHRDK